ncbi:MAG: histidine kinase [Gammaproteobacteria bacterium]
MNKTVREITRIAPHLFIEDPLIGICVTEDSQIVFCNARLADILGFSCEELYGLALSSVFQYERRQHGRGLYERRIDIAPHIREIVGSTKDGRTVYTRQSVYEFEHKAKRVAIWQVMDVTEQKAVQASLQESEKRLCFLSEQVLEAQERERRRVAAELHDGIGQSLSSIKFGLENTFKQLYEDLPEQVREKLVGAVSSIRATMEEVRRIAMDLRPAMLDDLGIEPTINWLCREFQLAHPTIRIIKKIRLRQVDVDATLSVVIFRILQETLNNIAKHANATQAHVFLSARRDEITLSVKDNGCGFAVAAAGEARVGFGLYSMKERATLSGGRLRICSTPGVGTRVEAKWPCSRTLGLSDWCPGRLAEETLIAIP